MGVRQLVERISGKKILKRRLPHAFGGGPLFVTTRGGGLRYWFHDLQKVDSHLFALVNEFIKPGMTVWDIGANMGLFTFSAAHRAGKDGFVLAVEADVDNAGLLLRSRFSQNRNTTAEVQILPVAVAQPGVRFASFGVSNRCRATNCLDGFGMGFTGELRETRVVPVLSINEMLEQFKPPAFVKIDVEGAEVEVLRGAERLLSQVRPILELEVAPMESHQEPIRELFSRHRYLMYDCENVTNERIPQKLPPFYCLAIPQ